MARTLSKLLAIEACRILNSLIGDLVVGPRTVELFESPGVSRTARPTTISAMRRMSVSHTILALAKVEEFFRHYSATVPQHLTQPVRELRRDLSRRRVVEFRNTCVGHIRSKETGHPLTFSELDARLKQVYGGDRNAFLSWVSGHDFDGELSVVGLVEALRDYLADHYALSETQRAGNE